jgi:hypothetical protein
VHTLIGRFWRICIEDTGNNKEADNFQAALDVCDQLVIPMSVAEDTSQGAAALVDSLREQGRGDLVDRAITVISGVSGRNDRKLYKRLHGHFGDHTRLVMDVPFEPSLVGGRIMQWSALNPRYIRAWERVTAQVAAGM